MHVCRYAKHECCCSVAHDECVCVVCVLPFTQFVCAEVRGVFGYVFCDNGDKFEVVDPDGEEPAEAYIEKITKVNVLA